MFSQLVLNCRETEVLFPEPRTLSQLVLIVFFRKFLLINVNFDLKNSLLNSCSWTSIHFRFIQLLGGSQVSCSTSNIFFFIREEQALVKKERHGGPGGRGGRENWNRMSVCLYSLVYIRLILYEVRTNKIEGFNSIYDRGDTLPGVDS